MKKTSTKENHIVNSNEFNLTGKVMDYQKVDNNGLLPKLSTKYQIPGNGTTITDNLKKVIYNYVQTKENNDRKVAEENNEPTDYFHLSLRDKENYNKTYSKKYEFLKPIGKNKNKNIKNEIGAFLRNKQALETSLGDYKGKH